MGACLEFVEVINRAWLNGGPTVQDVECGLNHDTPEGVHGPQVTKKVSEDNSQVNGQSARGGRYHRPLWMPCFRHSTTRQVYDSTFFACVIQLVGATVFIITGCVDLPGIRPRLTPLQKVLLEPRVIPSLHTR